LEKKDPGFSGNFEITILTTGELIHSKRWNGQGKAETEQERRSIVNKIEIALSIFSSTEAE